MTQDEWQAATDPQPMLEFVRDKAGKRKLRLFICASCRRGVDNIRTSCHLNGLDLAERYADGEASDDEREVAYRITRYTKKKNWTRMKFEALVNNALAPDDELSPFTTFHRVSNPRARAFQTATIRCLFGNPFHPIAVDPSWFTSTALALAEGIYTEQAFDRLPILADALMDAGCDNEDILSHCRQPGEHVRGCWVIDLLLGKS